MTARSRLAPTIAIWLLAGALLSACGSKSDKAERVALTLGDQMGLSRSKTEQAKSMENTAFDYRWADFASGPPLFEAMNAGAVDTGAAGDAPFVLAAAAHVPLKIVAVLRTTGEGIGILVPGSSPIRTPADLRGHHIVVSSSKGSVSEYLLLEVLRRQRIPVSDVTISFMPPGDAAAAFGAGQVDAWATFGSFQAVAVTRGARVLANGKGINSGLVVVVASDKALADPRKRVAISDYLRRQAQGNAWSHAHPEAYARLYARQTGVSAAAAAIIASSENPGMTPVDAKAVADLQLLADRYVQYGIIPKAVAIAPYVDATLFPPAKP